MVLMYSTAEQNWVHQYSSSPRIWPPWKLFTNWIVDKRTWGFTCNQIITVVGLNVILKRVLTLIITYTNTGVKSSAAAQDPESPNRSTRHLAHLDTQRSLSRGALAASRARRASWAGNQGHSRRNTAGIIRSLWSGCNVFESVAMWSCNTLKKND